MMIIIGRYIIIIIVSDGLRCWGRHDEAQLHDEAEGLQAGDDLIMCIYIYIYMYIYICCMCIYIYREIDREREIYTRMR